MELATELTKRVEESTSPEWYLRLFGSALEESGSPESALVVADKAYEKNKFPPSSNSEKIWKMIGDSEAMDEYSPGELKEIKPPEKKVETPKVEPSPFRAEKSLPYSIKARGEPCKQGQSATRTGCIPAKKPVGKVKPSGKKPVGKKPVGKVEKEPSGKKGSIKDLGSFESEASVNVEEYHGTQGALDVLKLSGNDVASLVGAPKEANVRILGVSNSDDPSYAQLLVYVDHPEYTQRRRIDLEDGKLVINNQDFRLKSGVQKGSGVGLNVFLNQIKACKAKGILKITTDAASGDDDQGGKNNGYYTWPRFGYDQPINKFDKLDKKKIAKAFPKAKNVLDVMKTKKGRDWWKKNEIRVEEAEFDLSDNSKSLKVFQAYLKERGK